MSKRFDAFWRNVVDSSRGFVGGFRFCFDETLRYELLEDWVEGSCSGSPCAFCLTVYILNDLVTVDWFLGNLVQDVVAEQALWCAVESIMNAKAFFLRLWLAHPSRSWWRSDIRYIVYDTETDSEKTLLEKMEQRKEGRCQALGVAGA